MSNNHQAGVSENPSLPFTKFVETRENQITPHIATIHDLCGYGNCSLAVAMPVLSAAGLDSLPVPTSILSNHTQYPAFTFLDTTSELEDYFAKWRDLNVPIAGAYTGFLGSTEQIDIIERFLKEWPEDLINIIDPVMGDHGKPYPTYSPEMCDRMKHLLPHADVLTPNLTEASILLGEEYPGQTLTAEEGEAMSRRLQARSGGAVVLKGMERGDLIYNGILDWDGNYTETSNPRHAINLHGTGDLFASAIAAGLYTGHKLQETVAFAGHLVYDAILVSEKQDGFRERGVTFEPLMGQIVEYARSADHSL